MTRRATIKLNEHEARLIRERYLAWRIPLDQFEYRDGELGQFTDEWNSLSGRSDSPGELFRHMRTQRKRGRWPRLNGDHRPMAPLKPFSPEETEALVRIYYDHVIVFENGSDGIAYEPEIGKLIAKEFFHATSRRVPAHTLNAKLTSLRKRGLLPKIGKRGSPQDEGFRDIDEVTRKIREANKKKDAS